MKSIEHDIPDDIVGEVIKDSCLPPSTPQNKYYWSRCLTEMRLRSINSSNARICVGGKLFGYNGKMPGVLEEVLIAFDMNKPVYLIGAFGGVVGDVCKAIRGESYPESLTEAWQIRHNAGYSDLQEIALASKNHADYACIQTTLQGVAIAKLAVDAGLDEMSYMRLMQTPFVDECIYLILQGLKKLASQMVELGGTGS